MRVERENGEPVGAVWAVLTEEEARFLLEALTNYFEGEREPGWHCHVDIAAEEPLLTVEIGTD